MELATTWKEIPESELPPEPKKLTVGELLEKFKAENFNAEDLKMPLAFVRDGELNYIHGASISWSNSYSVFMVF